jgi:hypothetical protein
VSLRGQFVEYTYPPSAEIATCPPSATDVTLRDSHPVRERTGESTRLLPALIVKPREQNLTTRTHLDKKNANRVRQS